jgi:NAD+ synthase
VDSAVSAVLGVRALGAANVLGMILPYRSSSPESARDAMAVAQQFGIEIERIDLTPMIDTYFGGTEVSSLRRGNKMARERMAILFDIASRDHRLVLGTSNKTEICLGYSTWYGDSACSLNPLGGLYKREVRETAAFLGVPSHIIEKHPTADLWPGQTDEGELGVTYDLADRVLYSIVEENERSLKQLMKIGADEKTIRLIADRMNRYLYKRTMAAAELLDGRPVPNSVVLMA